MADLEAKWVKVKAFGNQVIDFGPGGKLHPTKASQGNMAHLGCQSCYSHLGYPKTCPKCGAWVHLDIEEDGQGKWLSASVACDVCDVRERA